MNISGAKKFLRSLPGAPGVYIFRDKNKRPLYVGKAGNLRRRVSSYFLRSHDFRVERLIREIASIDHELTDTAIEALIREAELIKKLKPPFNVREKDDKSFLHVEITKDKFPRVLLVRGKDKPGGTRFGPFTSASSIREALRVIRKIFPWSAHPPEKVGKFQRECFDAEIGLCPGTCVGIADRAEYLRNIRDLKLFFRGRKSQVLRSLTGEMKQAAKELDFERAEKLRRRIFALRHVEDVAFISETPLAREGEREPVRIEGYDISNISGDSATGSMVVFTDGRPDKSQYRKFRIRTLSGSDDTGMLKEVLRRRFMKHAAGAAGGPPAGGWPLPDLVLVDGGRGQVNAAVAVLGEAGLELPVVGMAKGPGRKRTDIVGELPKGLSASMLVQVRDEAHRFAISYHKHLRGKKFLKEDEK